MSMTWLTNTIAGAAAAFAIYAIAIADDLPKLEFDCIMSDGTHCSMGTPRTSEVPPSDTAQLCIRSHPVKRLPNCTRARVTQCIDYVGLRPLRGYQRDHVIPLELGGPDTPENVRYQKLSLALQKDNDEHTAGGNMCLKAWSQAFAQEWLAAKWPVDAAHGYDR